MIQGNYVSFFKTRVPTRWRKAPVHPGQGCGIHSGPKNGHPEPQALLPVGRGRAVSDRIFGMPKPGYQWRRSRSRIMEFELIPSGPGPQGPGQFRMILKNKPQASSTKHQAPSIKRQAPRPDNFRLKKNKKRFDKRQAVIY